MSGLLRRLTKIAIGVSLLGVLLHPTADAQSPPELFQKLKSEVKAGSWAEALRTLGALQTESAKPGNEESRAKLEGPIAFYRGVCEANLGQTGEAVESFVTFLDIQPNATLDSAVYSKEAVAAFEEARTVVADRTPSLSSAYRSFEAPPDMSGRDPADKHWAEGPVKWILTDEEKAEWSRVTDPNARVDFVERFWAARATLPGASGRTYRQEFEHRVAFADVYLVHEAEQRGSLTDRGMVFVLLGAPTYASRRALRSGEDASEPSGMSRVETQEAKLALKKAGGRSSTEQTTWARYYGAENRALSTDDEYLEIWHYNLDRLPRDVRYRQVDVHYVTKKGAGKNVFQPDTASRTTLNAARRAAGPRAAPGRSSPRR